MSSGDQALAFYPNAGSGSIYPTHTLLVNQGGLSATAYLDGALLALFDPMDPFPASCPGFDAFLAAAMQPGIDCVAFRADMWTPPAALGEQYTCATDWYTGWTDENGDPLDAIPTVVDGFEPPALTPIGTDTGPGVCPAYVPPEPPRPRHRGPTTPPHPPIPEAPGPERTLGDGNRHRSDTAGHGRHNAGPPARSARPAHRRRRRHADHPPLHTDRHATRRLTCPTL
ncbi:MAG: hypothetical protein M5U31_10020 [Acidimicrobiia bacterium]|nr:hypothetical protein [Acidimicrobiia bacterium]